MDGKAVFGIGLVKLVAAIGVTCGFGENGGGSDRRAFGVAANDRPTGNFNSLGLIAVDQCKIR